MKGEIKLLPPELIQNVVHKCLKKPPIHDITQSAIITWEIFFIVNLLIYTTVLLLSLVNQAVDIVRNLISSQVKENWLLQLSIIIHALNAKMLRVKHQISTLMIILWSLECLSLQFPGIWFPFRSYIKLHPVGKRNGNEIPINPWRHCIGRMRIECRKFQAYLMTRK